MYTEIVTFIAKNLVDQPDAIEVTETRNGKNITLSLDVADGDMGRIIGRNGRVVNAIRNVLQAAAAKHGERVSLDIS